MTLARVLHVLGFSVWLGAALTFMIFGPAAKKASLESWAHTWRTLAVLQRVVVAPACAVATVTGVLLTMAAARRGSELGSATWLMLMQGFGLAAALLTLGVATPLANRMAVLAARSLEKGEREPLAERVRSRLALTGSVSGLFMLVALWFGTARG